MPIVKGRVWDYVLYLVISMLAVASIFVPSALNISPTEYRRWLALIFAALVILGFVIEDTKILRGTKIYWVFISAAVGVNGIVLAVLALEKIQVSGFILMCICFAEICLVHVLKKRVARKHETQPL